MGPVSDIGLLGSFDLLKVALSSLVVTARFFFFSDVVLNILVYRTPLCYSKSIIYIKSSIATKYSISNRNF